MVDTNKLRGAIRERGLTIADAANIAEISAATMQRKLKSGVFGTDEIDKLVEGLKIKNPTEIFFVRE